MMRKLLLVVLLLFCSFANAGVFMSGKAVIDAINTSNERNISANISSSFTILPQGHDIITCQEYEAYEPECFVEKLHGGVSVYKYAGMAGYKYVYHIISDGVGVIHVEVGN